MSRSSTLLPPPEGPGYASGAPHLPAGFTDTDEQPSVGRDGDRTQ
jgi:hypothetical protein